MKKILFLHYKFEDTDKTELFEYIRKNYEKKILFNISKLISIDHQNQKDIFMMKIFNNIEAYNPVYAFETWACRITRNHCIDYLKAKKHDESIDDNIPDNENAEKIYSKR